MNTKSINIKIDNNHLILTYRSLHNIIFNLGEYLTCLFVYEHDLVWQVRDKDFVFLDSNIIKSFVGIDVFFDGVDGIIAVRLRSSYSGRSRDNIGA